MRPRIGITSAPTTDLGRPFDRVSRWYVDAVLTAGGLPLILPTMAPEHAPEVLSGLDGLLLTGGGDVSPLLYGEAAAPEVYDVNPARDAWELALVAAASGGPGGDWVGSPIPVLGVCRGEQLLNVAAGGSLVQHLPDVTGAAHRRRDRDREPVHEVDIDPASQLAAITGRRRLGVTSIHHQAVKRLGPGPRAVAWSPDGTIEAIERTDGAPVVAVQWHPESLTSMAPHRELFSWLTRAAARRPSALHLPESFGATGATGATPAAAAVATGAAAAVAASGRAPLVDDPA